MWGIDLVEGKDHPQQIGNTTVQQFQFNCWIVTSYAVTNLPQGFCCDPRQRVLCSQGDH